MTKHNFTKRMVFLLAIASSLLIHDRISESSYQRASLEKKITEMPIIKNKEEIYNSLRKKLEYPEEKILTPITQDYRDPITVEYLFSLIKIESTWNPNAVSEKGARGYFQLMPNAWKDFGEGSFDNAFDPDKNLAAGIKQIKWVKNYLAERDPQWENYSRLQKQLQIAAALHRGHYGFRKEDFTISNMGEKTINHIRKIAKELCAEYVG